MSKDYADMQDTEKVHLVFGLLPISFLSMLILMFFTTSCEVFNNTDVPQKWLQIESYCSHFTDIKKKEDTLKHTHTDVQRESG